MSHRWDCPSEYEARRRGERDYENRGYRTYSPPEEYRGCSEAARAYQDGQRRAEYEQRLEEERRVSQQKQQEAQRQQYELWAQQEQEQEQEQEWIEREIEEACLEAWGEGP